MSWVSCTIGLLFTCVESAAQETANRWSRYALGESEKTLESIGAHNLAYLFLASTPSKVGRAHFIHMTDSEQGMKRPAIDKTIARAMEAMEMSRVNASLVKNKDGSMSEPLEWAEADSLAQRVSKLSQVGPFAMFKQFIADRLAGDFDEAAISRKIDEDIADNAVMMYSFTTCPFCLKAKKVLDEKKDVKYKVRELDVESDGYAVRAMLGRRTGRTSMPSVWVNGDYVGGANDGGLGGVVTLDSRGELDRLLKQAGAI